MPQPKGQSHFRTCNLCEAMCGIEITTSGKEIVSIKGDKKDPLSGGYLCPKAVALQDIHNDPDRLKQPLKKTATGWEEISWKEAFNTVEKKIKGIQKEYGKDAVGAYLGNPNTHNHGSIMTLLPFLKSLRTKKRFSATSNDQLPHMLVNLKLFGHQALFPVPDIDNTDLFICMGGNPLASNGSLMTAPNIKNRLQAIQERGGEVIVIDPRRTETAAIADIHHFIKPGSDALLLLAILHVLFDEGRVHTGRLTPYLKDVELLQVTCSAYSPRVVSKQTGIAAKDIRSLALKLANTEKALLYTRMGTSTQQFGTITTWLAYCINILTGHLDKRGGMMFTRPAIDIVELGAMAKQQGHFDRYRSRVSKLPEFSGELPASALAEEILTEGQGKIRAMVTSAGNPVLSSPNGKEVDRALKSLDFMVSVDFYLNETTRHADIILPPTGPLEHSHYDIVFNMVSVRNTVKYSPTVFKPGKNTKHDWEIFLELTKRFSSKDIATSVKAELRFQALHKLGIDGILDVLLRTGSYGSKMRSVDFVAKPMITTLIDLLPVDHPVHKLFTLGPYNENNQSLTKGLSLDHLRQFPNGLDLGPLQPCLPERLYHPEKKIKLAPKLFIKDLARLNDHFGLHSKSSKETDNSDSEFLLIGRRHIRCNNSWLHNSQRLVKGKDRCTLMIAEDDAARLDIKDGQQVNVSSAVGTLTIAAEVTDIMMPGVVSMPHGWGHNQANTKLRVANKTPGVSMNDLTNDKKIDKLSGTSILNGIPVTLSVVS